MSRKVDPRSLRTGVTKSWQSYWFAEGERYAIGIVEDYKIRTYLEKVLRSAGLDSIHIERSINSVKIVIRVSRPGIVIGRKGSGLTELRQNISKMTKSDIELQVEEVKKPELSASIVADSIAMQLERRASARRSANIAAKKTIESGAKGIKIEIAGPIHGPNSIAVTEMINKGAIPTQTIRADIDYAKSVSFTRSGAIGIKVWIYKGEYQNL